LWNRETSAAAALRSFAGEAVFVGEECTLPIAGGESGRGERDESSGEQEVALSRDITNDVYGAARIWKNIASVERRGEVRSLSFPRHEIQKEMLLVKMKRDNLSPKERGRMPIH
jgi:hypothetical protein